MGEIVYSLFKINPIENEEIIQDNYADLCRDHIEDSSEDEKVKYDLFKFWININ